MVPTLPPEAPPTRRPRLAVTLGDPCGIGPELLLRSLAVLDAWADVVVVGARAGLDLLLDTPGRRAAWRWTDPPVPPLVAFEGWTGGLEVRSLEETSRPGHALWLDPTPGISSGNLTLGVGSAASGVATVEAIRLGARLALSGAVDALVTLPMAKAAAHLAGHDLPGHTEFLQALSDAPITRMAFVSPSLSVVLHTVHQSLRSVVEGLDAEAVAETLRFTADQFVQLTGRPDLRVALCALNPHAGEEGAFGNEEALLRAAIARVEPPAGQQPVPRFFGPLPSDSLFHRAVRGEFDVVVALYHDQGLIPVKVLEPDRAVNVTLGLPFVRTSPDHGTAFDKAGRWIANPANFQEAAALAIRLAGRVRGQSWQPGAAPGGA